MVHKVEWLRTGESISVGLSPFAPRKLRYFRGAKGDTYFRAAPKVENKSQCNPIHLVWMVKKVAWLDWESTLARQPDSPSRQAGWGLGFFAFVASWPTFFTIRASRMGSLRDLCGTTSPKVAGSCKE